jgi:hypothetical protein
MPPRMPPAWLRQEPARRHHVAMHAALLRNTGEAVADLHALDRVDRHHRRGQVAVQLAVDRLAPARRHAIGDHGHPRADRIAGLAQRVHVGFQRIDLRGVRPEERIVLDRRTHRSPAARSRRVATASRARARRAAPPATSWRSPPRRRAWWSRARCCGRRRADRGCRISASRCSRRGRAELRGDLAVVLAALVGVADQQRDRRAGGDAFVDAAEDLDLVGFAPLRGVPRGAGRAARQVVARSPPARSRCPAGSRRPRSRSPARAIRRRW